MILTSAGDLLETYARLKRRGIEPYWPVHHGTTMSLYYADPDGNRMEFQVDVGTVQEATALMKSPAFAANPVGVSYDPDALFARWKSGEDEDSLLAQPAGRPHDAADDEIPVRVQPKIPPLQRRQGNYRRPPAGFKG